MKCSKLAIMLLTMGAPAAFATQPTDPIALQKKLEERFPSVKIDRVQESSVPGLYEVITTDRIVYADASGEHLIIGQIMNTTTRQNLTEQRWNDLNRIDFNSLPFEHAIKIVKGDGSRKLVAFEDPLCPYCAELEKALETLTDYTLFVFLLPLESIHPGATVLARSIWCADDPAATWSAWMQRDVKPEARSCDTVPGEQLGELAKKLKINSTPTLYFADGIKVPQALTAAELEARWAQFK